MKKSIILSIIIVTFLVSCEQNDSNTTSETVQTPYESHTTIVTTTTEATVTTQPILIERLITDSSTQIELNVGETTRLDCSTLPENMSVEYTQIEWLSTDNSIATVDSSGNVTAIENGICTVSATSVNDPNVTLKFTITVKGNVKNSIKSTTIVFQTKPQATTSETETYTETTPNSNVIQINEPVEENQTTFINGILLVNDSHPLPHDYAPSKEMVSGSFGLYSYVQEAFDTMSNDASLEGLSLSINCGYVPYTIQYEKFENSKMVYGIEYTDTILDQASYSESQTGLSILLNSADETFNDTPEARWIAENCHRYGFIVRYPEGKENLTYKNYRSFQIRYVGIGIATEMFNQGICLEEYLGV